MPWWPRTTVRHDAKSPFFEQAVLAREKSPSFELQSMLLVEENHVRTRSNESEGHMLYTHSNGGRGRPSINQRSWSKSRDNRICNYSKKPGHIKADWRALKAKTDKPERADQRSNRHEEVNYVGSSAEILTTDRNILSIENLGFGNTRPDTLTQFESETRSTVLLSESAP